jgi:hypothetical protein
VHIKNPKLHAEHVLLAALFRVVEPKCSTSKKGPLRKDFFELIIELRDRDESVFPAWKTYSAKFKTERQLNELRFSCKDTSYDWTSEGSEETEANYVRRFLAEHAGEMFSQQL